MDPNAFNRLPNITLCAWCKEDIKPGAVVCKHCGRDPRPVPPCRFCGTVLVEGSIKKCPTWATVLGWVSVLLGLFGSAFVFGLPAIITGICLLVFVREPTRVLKCPGTLPNGLKCTGVRPLN